MSHDLQQATIKIAKHMESLRNAQIQAEVVGRRGDAEGLAVFMGLGLALGVCFEQGTGKSFRSEKPNDILNWALSLGQEQGKVRLT